MDTVQLQNLEVHLQNVQMQIKQIRILQDIQGARAADNLPPEMAKEMMEARVELNLRISRLLQVIAKLES